MRAPAFFLSCLFTSILAAPASAVTVRELTRACGDDAEKFCPDASYGKEMQDCLNENRRKTTRACRAVMDRVNGGEKVTLF